MPIDESKIMDIISAADGRYIKKVVGKDLSTNDYTDEEKQKLANLTDIIVDDIINAESNNPVKNSTIKTALDKKLDIMEFNQAILDDIEN